jgi:hypothetical protein
VQCSEWLRRSLSLQKTGRVTVYTKKVDETQVKGEMMFKSEGLIDEDNGEPGHDVTRFEEAHPDRLLQQKLPSQISLLLIEWPIALGVWLVGTYQLFVALRAILGGVHSELVTLSLLCLACIAGAVPMAIYSLLAERHRKTPRLLLIDVVAIGAIILWLVFQV